MYTLEQQADARYTPFAERARAVIAPVTSLSDNVDVLDQSDFEIVTISEKQMMLLSF